tara:strand:+ start:92277 stop:92735 length:459 start_codon:yes stop_codon:yes gene_type:complete
MARVTVEDSLENVDNRFELILLASKRARDLMMTGDDPRVAWDNDKPTVVALREIADGSIDISYMDEKPEIMADIDFDAFAIPEVAEVENEGDMDPDAALIAALSAAGQPDVVEEAVVVEASVEPEAAVETDVVEAPAETDASEENKASDQES